MKAIEQELERCKRISATRRDQLVDKAKRVLEAETAAAIMRRALKSIVRDLSKEEVADALNTAEQALRDEFASRIETTA